MSTNLTLVMDDRPGALADLGIALGRAGINVEGICGIVSEGKARVHFLVENAESAKEILEQMGMEVCIEPRVLVIPIEDRPGEMGKLCRRIANIGINLELVYLASNNRLVIGGENLERALAIL